MKKMHLKSSEKCKCKRLLKMQQKRLSKLIDPLIIICSWSSSPDQLLMIICSEHMLLIICFDRPLLIICSWSSALSICSWSSALIVRSWLSAPDHLLLIICSWSSTLIICFAHNHFRAPKCFDFQGPPLATDLVKDSPASKSLRPAPYKQQVH